MAKCLVYKKEFLMHSGDKPKLTLGNKYKVFASNSDRVMIENDIGHLHQFYLNRESLPFDKHFDIVEE